MEIKNSEYLKELQAKRIRECMAELGLKGKYIAEKLNYTPQHISYVLNGKRTLTIELATKLAKLFTEHANEKKIAYVEIPYAELSKEDKIEYASEVSHDGYVKIPFIEEGDIYDPRYLLGETDNKTHYDLLYRDGKEPYDLFTIGLIAILKKYGYDLNISPHITNYFLFCDMPSQNSFFFDSFQKMLKDSNSISTLTDITNNKSINLLPYELKKLFSQFYRAINAVVEQAFDSAELENIMSLPPLFKYNVQPDFDISKIDKQIEAAAALQLDPEQDIE